MILDRMLQNIMGKVNTERPPFQAVGGLQIGTLQSSTNRTSQLSALDASGWLFATIDRIASSTASVEWVLHRKRVNGEMEEVATHPAMELWQAVNPFYTREEFIEVSMNHFLLTGEMFWVALRNRAGIPQELWPIRPDRITPVPDRQNYIKGYIYRVGSEAIPLEPQDVIFTRRPSPLDPYRGGGPIPSIMNDLGIERDASAYARNFYQNSAVPGGIIELQEELDDAAWEKFVMRWKTQHQGVQNAHRVAVLERATWKTAAFSHRDMQFEQLRRLERDIIIGAYGMPQSMLGITESVNRANAEAGEFMFTKWIIVPNLRRLRASLNERLLPLFGSSSSGLQFDFVDPTPQNRELALKEATEGYKGGFLSKNEARERLGEAEAPDGDTFLVPMTFGGPRLDDTIWQRSADDSGIRPDDVNRSEDTMEAKWERRLNQERRSLEAFLESLV